MKLVSIITIIHFLTVGALYLSRAQIEEVKIPKTIKIRTITLKEEVRQNNLKDREFNEGNTQNLIQQNGAETPKLQQVEPCKRDQMPKCPMQQKTVSSNCFDKKTPRQAVKLEKPANNISSPSKKEKKKNRAKVANLLRDRLKTLENRTLTPSTKPKDVPELKIEQATYSEELSFYLQSMLVLPKEGLVKIELTLKRDGSLLTYTILFSQSVMNQNYIQENLSSLHFPPFGDCYKNEQNHTFTITLEGNREY
ncbi:MAG: hypothetical protein KDK55_05700 [Chlamydiia bacterium]|nr:hypothetical protein [Chlamydiia bacterium]